MALSPHQLRTHLVSSARRSTSGPPAHQSAFLQALLNPTEVNLVRKCREEACRLKELLTSSNSSTSLGLIGWDIPKLKTIAPSSPNIMTISGPAAAALDSLSPEQIQFLHSIPKAELHAHLNGSIPISVLQELATEYLSSSANTVSNDAVRAGIETLLAGPVLDEIHDFFHLFPAIYALTSTPAALARATRAVLRTFLDSDGDAPQCTHLELRTTPRATPAMSREVYLQTVLAEVERYDAGQVGLIVSIDRRMGADDLRECLDLACKLRKTGRRVVGLDLCGDPLAGNMDELGPYFEQAKKNGLGITLHIAETTENSAKETLRLLSYGPDRLGHATFLNEEAVAIVLEKKMCIEICLSSNLLCKTVQTLESHHILQYLRANHPISICTDDILPFRTSLTGEYAMLLATKPLGLGLSEDEVKKISEMSLAARFN